MGEFRCAITIFSILLLLSTSLEAKEAEDEFSYKKGSERGPEKWGKLRPEWAACGNGRQQSPIELVDEKVVVDENLGLLDRRYRGSQATVANRGHAINLKWGGGAGGLWINGTKYVLEQVHWHTPSEHVVDGRKFAAEMHMVHTSADKKGAVVAVLYELGEPDPFIGGLEQHINAIKNTEDAEADAGSVNPISTSKSIREQYYRYTGSLTTPPCTGGVVWTVLKEVRSVSSEQIALLKDAVVNGYEENARPVQATNGRTIRLYTPDDSQI